MTEADNDDTRPEWVCMKCAQAYPTAGQGDFCPKHPDEPLLDGNRDEVLFEMMRTDDKARSRLYGFWILVMGGGGLLIGCVIMFFFILFLKDLAEEVMWFILVGPLSGGTALGFVTAKKRYKRKFSRWTDALDPDAEAEQPWPTIWPKP